MATKMTGTGLPMWEYTTGAMGAHSENAVGQDGWELVAVHEGIMFYKRPYVAAPETAETAAA